MKRSLFPLAWCYVAAFALAMFACHNAEPRDPGVIETTPVVLP